MATLDAVPELLPVLCPNESDRPEGRSQINDKVVVAGERSAPISDLAVPIDEPRPADLDRSSGAAWGANERREVAMPVKARLDFASSSNPGLSQPPPTETTTRAAKRWRASATLLGSMDWNVGEYST